MNREIKFRAWNGKELFNVDVLAISPCTWDCPDFEKRGVSLAYQPHLNVMQYTGLKDKNGNDIYEGDIATAKNHGTQVVTFEKGMFKFGSMSLATFVNVGDFCCEIIGNIYENPLVTL